MVCKLFPHNYQSIRWYEKDLKREFMSLLWGTIRSRQIFIEVQMDTLILDRQQDICQFQGKEAHMQLYNSNSDVASPVIIVIQKGKPRYCVELREVNSKTIADRYALPKQDSIFRARSGVNYFSVIEANKGYYQFGLTGGADHTQLL